MRTMPGPGQRNHLVSFLKPAPGTDEYGQPLSTYAWVDDVWAELRPVTQREYTASRQTEAAIDAVLRIPYRTDIEATWIVLYEGKLYDIQSQVEVGFREGTQLFARVRQQ